MRNGTPTEDALLEILADGEPHDKAELMGCLDEFTTAAVLKCHLSNMRKKIPQGYEIISQAVGGRNCYRLIRRITTDEYPKGRARSTP